MLTKTPDLLDIQSPTDVRLAEHAEAIRVLGKRAVGDIIEIGRRLTEAKSIAGHGGWLPWLGREFGWSVPTAERFMRCHELAIKNVNLTNLDIGVSALYALAAPSTPEAARNAVVAEAAKGEKKLSHAEVTKMIAAAKKEGAAEAAERAKEKLATAQQSYESKLAKANELHDKLVAKITKDLTDSALPKKMVVEAINEAVRAASEKRDNKIASLKAELEKQAASAKRVAVNPYAQPAVRVRMALESLATAVANVTPEQVVEAQAFITKMTSQTMRDGLADEIRAVKLIRPWLDKFTTATKEIE